MFYVYLFFRKLKWLSLIGNRISCRPTLSVIILVIKKRTSASRSSDSDNHSYDYRPNWTPLGSITIINGQYASFHRARPFVVHFAELAVEFP